MAGKNSYDDLYADTSLFDELFPDFDSLEQRAALTIWSRALARCGVDYGMPPVVNIVDFGCGKGTLIAEIDRLANETPPHRDRGGSRRPSIRVFGADCSATGIALAKQRYPHLADNFYLWAGPPAAFFGMLEADRGVIWNDTALACLGHTWFHLDQTEMCRAVSTYRPAVLLLDIFHSWDRTIRQIQGGQQEVLEEGRSGRTKGTYFFLKTCAGGNAGEPKTVSRGIWQVTHRVGEGPREEWLLEGRGFPTTQYAYLTSDLIVDDERLKSQYRERPGALLDHAKREGLITGETPATPEATAGTEPRISQCDYIPRKTVRHAGGWGAMDCHVLVPRDTRAIGMNRAYFQAVRDVVKDLFVEDARGNTAFGQIRDMLRLFNRPDPTAGATDSCIDGSEAVIVLPFDRHTTFARIIGLSKNQTDRDIAEHDLVLECPTTAQQRFPTAYGAFHTLEDRISSPQAFPLKWATDYDHSATDLAFNKLEEPLLGLVTTEQEDTDQFGFFVLPVYFGSLPLFSLILRYPSLFQAQSTNFHLYLSALTNLHNGIKVALTDDYVRLRVLRPWIAAALQAAPAEPVEARPGVTNPVSAYLDRLEKTLFGRQAVGDESRFENTPLEKQSRDGGVIQKPWKSWLMCIPSYPIKKLQVVIAENERLWRLWQGERQYFETDPALRLSAWFEKSEFFSKSDTLDVHAVWNCKVHVQRLHHMFTAAGFSLPPQTCASDDGWLADALAEMRDVFESEAVASRYPYFASVGKHFLFRWLCEQLKSLKDLKRSCDFEEVRINDVACPRNQGSYQDLKAVFCKSLANHGARVRFGSRRVWCLLSAAATGVTITPQKEVCGKLGSAIDG